MTNLTNAVIAMFQVTYLLSGAITHEDFAGHRGTIHSGDLQASIG